MRRNEGLIRDLFIFLFIFGLNLFGEFRVSL